MDILWRDGALFVVGPDRVAAHPALAPGAQVLGHASVPPGIGRAGPALAGIIGQAVPLADLKGAWAIRAAASIGDTAPAQRLQRMAHCLQQHMGAAVLDTPATRAHALFQALAAGHATLDTLAAHVGLSPRSLRRFSQSQFGYGAKTLERILRLQRFLRHSRALPQHSRRCWPPRPAMPTSAPQPRGT